jgi:hypothetical protein
MKFINYIAIGSLAVAASACSNWLDLEPSTSVDNSKGLQTLQQVDYSLNGTYSLMQNSNAYSGRLVYYADVCGDDMQAGSSTKRTGDYYLFNYNKDNAPSTHWSYLYEIIRSCNVILRDTAQVRSSITTTKDNATLTSYIGEALAIRGLALFDLTRLFGYPYTKDNGASLGVPVITTVLGTFDLPKRNTVAECYKQIISDLTSATQMINTDFNKGRINKWAAMALLSRVYLYKGDQESNTKALQLAEATIAGAEAAKYRLWTNDEYPKAWGNDAIPDNPGEILFEIVNLTTDSPGNESLGYLNSKDGYDDYFITSSFYELLMQDPNDVRLKLLSFDGTKCAYVNKYQPQPTEVIQDANIPLVRLSEVYLIAAEAAQRLNDNDDAVKYLNPIVQRADPANTVEGTTITQDRIMLERRKELVGEGHRLYDVMRNGLQCERKNTTNSDLQKKMTKAKMLSGSYPKTYDNTYYKIILPIPKSEMNTNPNIADQQNPGY